MEGNLRWAAVAAIGPIAWGSNYFVTNQYLPADSPIWGSVIRALPAGLILLALRRERPRGSWWWKSALLGLLNIGAFFVLIYVAAQRLPSGIASTTMATAPIVMMFVAWLLLAQRPQALPLAGGGLGVIGVVLMLAGGSGAIDPLGVAASVGAMVMSSFGYVLTQRWRDDVDVLPMTAWQLVAGGLMLIPVAVLVEGAPPVLDASSALAFGYVVVVATALANWAWFAALRRMRAGTVGLIGLLNPVTGVALGVLVGGELLGLRQVAGLALVLIGIAVGQPVVSRWWRRRPQPRRVCSSGVVGRPINLDRVGSASDRAPAATLASSAATNPAVPSSRPESTSSSAIVVASTGR